MNPTKLDWSLKNLRGKIVILNLWHHLVDVSAVGGANYWLVVNKNETQQDVYENVTIEQKAQLFTNMLVSSANSNYSDPRFYINFLSMAGGWRPWKSSKELDPLAWNIIKSNQQFNKLGMIFMDYPGPSLIQSIYKTNYNITEKEMKESFGYPWNDFIFIEQKPEENANWIKISGQGSLYGYTFELYEGDKLLGTTKCESHSEDAVDITFGDNINFKTGQKLTIKAYYDKTQENAFYPSNTYNLLTAETTVVASDYVAKWKAFQQDIKNNINNFAEVDSALKQYLSNSYVKVWSTMSRPTQRNKELLTTLKQRFDNDVNNLNQFKTDLAKLNQTINDLKDNNDSLINNENIEAISLYPNQVKSLINSSISINKVDWENSLNNLEKRQGVLDNINSIVNDYKNLNEVKQYLETKTNFKDKGLTYWTSKVNNIELQLNPIIKKVIDNLDNKLEQQNTILSFKADANTLQSNLEKVKTKIATYEQYFATNNLNKEQQNLFRNEIENSIIGLNETKPVLKQIDNYLEKFNSLKQIIENYEDFANEYHFKDLPTNLKDQYTTLINEIRSNLNKTNNALPLNDIETYITNLTDLQTKIKNEYNEYKLAKRKYDEALNKVNNYLNKIKAKNNNKYNEAISSAESTIAETQKAVKDNLVSTLNTQTEFLNNLLLNLQKQINDIDRQTKFEAIYNDFEYSINQKDKLPSDVNRTDLIANNKDIEISNLVLNPNDEEGKLNISYTINYDGLKQNKRQKFEGFWTKEYWNKLQYIKDLEDKRHEADNLLNELRENPLYKEIYDELAAKLNKYKDVNISSSSDDIIEAFNEINKAINNAKIQKEIADNVGHVEQPEENKTKTWNKNLLWFLILVPFIIGIVLLIVLLKRRKNKKQAR
ncbi:hypothetical protein FJO69_00600 [[Mycoplasma] falconis]|uniref:Lipoprotein-associated type-17 domain-containing protein n=1 Tax=[Mycoplasma] falconis TaxID=92403 RepID=A0A501XCK3_9BACT|nr:lipoprotein 17-related variable surface protein [[Mycoplasma] falconis]TPE58093.1 hypothetical protein FJO69_00600 [[Mycoplasma] falconis]